MIKDSEFITRAQAEAMAEAAREFQHEQVRLQKLRDAETLAPDAGRDRTMLEAQIGRPLQRAELVKRLQSLMRESYYERSIADPDKGGIYMRGQFIVGMEHGISPEFSLMEETEHGHGRILMRGWRSVLVALIHKGYITQTAAEKAFDIHRGGESERWTNYL